MSKIYTFSEVNKRENNEDCCLSFDLHPYVKDNQGGKISVLLLSDGMGGHKHGEIVSTNTIAHTASIISQNVLKEFFEPKQNGKHTLIDRIDFPKIITDAIHICNHKIQLLIKNNKWKKAGATLVVTIVVNDTYYWGHLGDSRLYHWSQSEGKLTQVTDDHSVVAIMLKEGAITPQIAKFHAQKHQLVYHIGIEKIPPPEKIQNVGVGKLRQNDILFLCSDGISGKPDHEELSAIFKKHLTKKEPKSSPPDKSEQINSLITDLFSLSRKLKEKDNQTLVLFIADDLEDEPISNEDRTAPSDERGVETNPNQVPPERPHEDSQPTRRLESHSVETHSGGEIKTPHEKP